MRIFSWNVNGLRAVINKGALTNFLDAEKPNILCLQEIKCKPEQCDFDFASLGYEIFYNPADRPGYSGTAILTSKSLFSQYGEILPIETNIQPKRLENDFCGHPQSLRGRSDETRKDGLEERPQKTVLESLLSEGRILTLEFQNFYLVNVYVPNSKPDLSRLELRKEIWDPNFLKYLKRLEKTKPVITCGDFNAAHTEIDLARPKTNHHNAGFTDEERQGITNILQSDFIDTFRHLNPGAKRYTWWSHWGHARENNVGWRIDYFFISKSLLKNLKSAKIYERITGSDHCPISIEMEV